MARYAFNELLSFVAGWAILLDFLILIAISTLSIGHYLSAFWSTASATTGLDLAIALGVLVLVARYNYLGKAPRGRRTIALSIVDMALVLHDRRARARHGLRPAARSPTTSTVGEVPTWPDLLFGMTVAVIAYTGIEAAANLAPEVRVGSEALRRTVGAGRRRGPARVRRDVGGRADGPAGRAGRADVGRQPDRRLRHDRSAASGSRRPCWAWSRRSRAASPASCSRMRSRSSRRWC